MVLLGKISDVERFKISRKWRFVSPTRHLCEIIRVTSASPQLLKILFSLRVLAKYFCLIINFSAKR